MMKLTSILLTLAVASGVIAMPLAAPQGDLGAVGSALGSALGSAVGSGNGSGSGNGVSQACGFHRGQIAEMI